MRPDWIDELVAEGISPIHIQARELDVLSEVAAIRRRAMDHGPADYVTIWIRSSIGDTSVENTTSFEPSESYSRADFERSFQQSREWFADLLAQDVLGIAPPRPVVWHGAIWNPNDPAKRANVFTVPSADIPRTLVMQDLCDHLNLPDAPSGLKTAVVKVLATTFFTEVQPAEMSTPMVVGADLINRAREGHSGASTDISELFLSQSVEAVVARRKSKEKTVLIVGSHSDEGIRRMRRIEGFLHELGYEPILIKDFGSDEENLETKLLSFALIARFVIYEASFSSGAIDEFKIFKDNEIITAKMYETGRMATAMQAHYANEHQFIRFFEYQPDTLKARVTDAVRWAESIVSGREERWRLQREKDKYR